MSRSSMPEATMSDDRPLEPDAVLVPRRTPVPLRRGRAPVTAFRPWLPVLRGAASRGPLLTASVLAIAAAALRAAGLAGRIASRTPSVAAGSPGEQGLVSGRVEVSWTRIEIRTRG